MNPEKDIRHNLGGPGAGILLWRAAQVAKSGEAPVDEKARIMRDPNFWSTDNPAAHDTLVRSWRRLLTEG